jgi:hypothetical protein
LLKFGGGIKIAKRYILTLAFSLYTARMKGARMKLPEDRSDEFRQDTKLYSKSWVCNFLWLSMLVAIPYMAGFSQTKQKGQRKPDGMMIPRFHWRTPRPTPLPMPTGIWKIQCIPKTTRRGWQL